MKIQRHRNQDGQVIYSAAGEGRQAELLAGSIEKGFQRTGETVEVGSLMAPLDPKVVFCTGLNYRKHAEETGMKIPQWPILFFKSPAALQHPGGPICIPSTLPSEEVDFECELAVVLGKAARNVRRDEALSYVLGYTCANDVSARDWQRQAGGHQWCRGKTFDTFLPLGPWIVTTDEIPDPSGLALRTLLNGEVVQASSTADMIFDVPAIIEYFSADTTLPAGTVILTGTPSGVGMGRKPPLWMKPGDVVTIEIESIGSLANPVTLAAR